MTHPPFVSYDFQPAHVVTHGPIQIKFSSTMRALAKDGTIWETFEGPNAKWQPWEKVGEVAA